MTTAAVADNTVSSGQQFVSHWPPTQLAPAAAGTMQLQPVVSPDVKDGVDKLVHHGDAVMWRRSDAK